MEFCKQMLLPKFMHDVSSLRAWVALHLYIYELYIHMEYFNGHKSITELLILSTNIAHYVLLQ
jgi:hypothetical protein